MADWETLPVFANSDVFRAEHLQAMWQNLQTLKNPNYLQNQLNNDLNSWVSSSTSFVDVDTVKLRHQFETYGGDFLAAVTIKHFSAAAGNSLATRFELDGVAYGNSGGLARFQRVNLTVSSQMIYLFENIAAGPHTLDVQFAVVSGVATIYEDPCNRFTIQEY